MPVSLLLLETFFYLHPMPTTPFQKSYQLSDDSTQIYEMFDIKCING